MYGVVDAHRYVRQQARRLIREPAADAVERVRLRWRSALIRTVRLTGAAALAYAVAAATLSDPRPLTAALTALLIVQVTLLGTIADSIRRILAVVLGVTLAIALSDLVPFSVWSLSAVIAVSILLGLLMRLGPHLLEVPISAMLVLGVGGADAAATEPDQRDPGRHGRRSGAHPGAAAGRAEPHRGRGGGETSPIEMAELLERVAGDLGPAGQRRAGATLAGRGPPGDPSRAGGRTGAAGRRAEPPDERARGRADRDR